MTYSEYVLETYKKFWSDRITKSRLYRPSWMITMPVGKAEETIYYFTHGRKYNDHRISS